MLKLGSASSSQCHTGIGAQCGGLLRHLLSCYWRNACKASSPLALPTPNPIRCVWRPRRGEKADKSCGSGVSNPVASSSQKDQGEESSRQNQLLRRCQGIRHGCGKVPMTSVLAPTCSSSACGWDVRPAPGLHGGPFWPRVGAVPQLADHTNLSDCCTGISFSKCYNMSSGAVGWCSAHSQCVGVHCMEPQGKASCESHMSPHTAFWVLLLFLNLYFFLFFVYACFT